MLDFSITAAKFVLSVLLMLVVAVILPLALIAGFLLQSFENARKEWRLLKHEKWIRRAKSHGWTVYETPFGAIAIKSGNFKFEGREPGTAPQPGEPRNA